MLLIQPVSDIEGKIPLPDSEVGECVRTYINTYIHAYIHNITYIHTYGECVRDECVRGEGECERMRE